MTSTLIFLILLAAAASVVWFLFIRKQRIRAALMVETPPREMIECLEQKLPVYSRLPKETRTRLNGLIQIFLAEKRFEPCGGIEEITDEMAWLVAGQACLLEAGMEKPSHFPRLNSILIYPHAYRDSGRRTFSLREKHSDTRLGESWDSGSVVLSWDDVLEGAERDDDGINVVYHEFAHQLDQVDSNADGAPPLPGRGDYIEWSKVFQKEYDDLQEAVHSTSPRKTLIDPYGATNPAEFFACATETFFEEPRAMQRKHPELYEQLKKYYGLDPVSWE